MGFHAPRTVILGLVAIALITVMCIIYKDYKKNATQEEIEELGKWEIQSEQIDVIRQFLRLDAYGRMNVKTLIQREFLRCLEQGTDQDISNIKIGIKTLPPDDEGEHID